MILNHGQTGKDYNIAGENEWENVKLVILICELLAKILGKEKNYFKHLITFVEDRSGHDRRYAINCDRLEEELGWKSHYNFMESLEKMIKWYVQNQDWVNNLEEEKKK